MIDLVDTCALAGNVRDEILALCRAAYDEDLADYLVNAGPGVHLLGRVDGILVTHAMVVERWLETAGGLRLRTVELVATRPAEQRRGYATAIMRRLAEAIHDFDIGGLSPTDDNVYARLGWEMWRGSLFVRTDTGLVPSPDERLMVRRLPRTPATLSLDEAVSIEWRSGETW